MNKRERVLAAMDGKTVDRVPTGFYTHFMSPEDQKDNAVKAVTNWFRTSDMDCLCIETDGYMEYPLEKETGHLSDWFSLPVIPKESHYIAGQLDRAKRIREELKDGALFFMIYTPFSTIKHTIGGEMLVMDYYRENRQKMAEVMKRIEEVTFYLMDYLMEETGIDGLFLSLQNAEIDRFSAETYREYLRPWDLRLLEKANSLSDYNIVHMCSWTGVPNQLDLWKDYPYKTVNWAVTVEKEMNLAQGRSYFKPGTTVMGGFDSTENGILYRGTKEQIKAYTKKQLKLAGQRGTILCGDCSMPMDIDPVRLRYVAEACEEYAQGDTEYPVLIKR